MCSLVFSNFIDHTIHDHRTYNASHLYNFKRIRAYSAIKILNICIPLLRIYCNFSYYCVGIHVGHYNIYVISDNGDEDSQIYYISVQGKASGQVQST
jgi:hypothetical protein